jgi:hypothetical protein
MTTESDAHTAATTTALEVENFTESYKVIADWIRFADSKAGVTLTVNGILMGLLVPTLKSYLAERTPHPLEGWTVVVVVLFVVWLVFLVLSAASAFLCILPIRGTARRLALTHAPHFHPAAVTQSFPLVDVDRFVKDCERLGADGMKREIMASILVDSHLSNTKYAHVTRAVWLLGGNILFACLYLLAIQF